MSKLSDKHPSIVDWFDVKNILHIRAFHLLQETGSWPKGFIPDTVRMPTNWQNQLLEKLAERYIAERLKLETE
jgi:hypothetical protein